MGIQALTGVTGVLSAVAMQAQLAAIEKSIASVSEDVSRVQLTLDIQAASRIRGVSEALQDLYESASATGIMTEATWSQVAPLGAQAFTNRDYADRRLRALLEDLGDRKSTADRRSWFKKYQPELIDAMLELDEAERSVIQFTILRLWWLNVTNDPALTYYAEDLSSRLLDRSERRDAVKLAVASTIHDAAKSAWFHWVLSPFDTRSNERAVERLLASLMESGLLSTRDVQVLTSESPPDQLEGLDRPAGADGLG